MFTIGLFSVADALLDMPMTDVLASLPFTEEIQAALLRHEGPKGEILATVAAYERGEFPTLPGDDRAPFPGRRLPRRHGMGRRSRPRHRLTGAAGHLLNCEQSVCPGVKSRRAARVVLTLLRDLTAGGRPALDQ